MESKGWLIEKFNEFGGKPWWLMLKDEYLSPKPRAYWTEDAYQALRFARRQDAFAVAKLYPEMCVGCSITEHVWMNGKTQPEGTR